jgi:hypothetical protein
MFSQAEFAAANTQDMHTKVLNGPAHFASKLQLISMHVCNF